MSNNLKPARCGCGGEAQIAKKILMGNLPDVYIFCRNCSIRTGEYYSVAEAVEAWNRAMGERTAKVNVLYRDESVIFGHCKCGQAVNTYATYCHKCGARLEWK